MLNDKESNVNKFRRSKIPPSQLKYEKTHPVVSCRLTLDVYERLQKAKKLEGITYTDILMMGLEKTELLNTELETNHPEKQTRRVQ